MSFYANRFGTSLWDRARFCGDTGSQGGARVMTESGV